MDVFIFPTQQWNFWHEEEVEFSLPFGKQQDSIKDHYCYNCMNVKTSNNDKVFNGCNVLTTRYIQSQCDINTFITPSSYLFDELMHNVQKSWSSLHLLYMSSLTKRLSFTVSCCSETVTELEFFFSSSLIYLLILRETARCIRSPSGHPSSHTWTVVRTTTKTQRNTNKTNNK